MAKILIVEDERSIIDILKFNLVRGGFEVTCADNGDDGFALASGGGFDLVLLDVMLPGLDGFEICKRLRASRLAVPIIMLTAREEENDMVLGLELGADDYITKPFSMKELLARVRANIRRKTLDEEGRGDAPSESGRAMEFDRVRIDEDRAEVSKDGQTLELTQREYELVLFLAKSEGHVFSREELMEHVWNYEYYGDLRTVDVTVRRLREKLEDNPAEPRYIVTRRGMGYCFKG